MIRKEFRLDQREKFVGGKGTTLLYHLLEKEEMSGHGRLFAVNVLNPGCSIGWHKHTDEFEVYYMLTGEAVYEDNDHNKTHIRAGEMTFNPNGTGHGIENCSNDDVKFLAVVLFKNNEIL